MKKITYLVAILLLSGFANAQATLEHSYATSVLDYDKSNAFQLDSGLYYYTVDNLNVLHIYNSNHEVYKTITIPIEANYSINKIAAITNKLFNTDEYLEFIVISEYYTGNTTLFSTKLIDESGSILQDFGNRNEISIIKQNTTYKLITDLEPPFTGNGGFLYDVYALPGTTLGNILAKANKSTVYPVPANNVINLFNDSNDLQKSGKIEIFNIEGKKVISKNVETGEKNISINITDLESGIYLYHFNNTSGKFIKR